jgi:hypothetical protein
MATRGLSEIARHLGALRFVVAGLLAAGGAGAATIVVNDASDALHGVGCAASGTGTCTLRDAITFANAHAGSDEIHFAISGSGVHTIKLDSFLPVVTGDLTIDGYTQPGSSPNTNAPGLGDNAVLHIEINGNGKGCLAFGGVANTIRGLVINRCGGFGVQSVDVGNGRGQGVVVGNFIGTDPTGKLSQANGVLGDGGGVLGGGGFSGGTVGLDYFPVTVGGTSPEDKNVISGNSGFGVLFSLEVVGNFIGVDASGTEPLANDVGVGVPDASSVGGATPGAGNVISGNRGAGVVSMAAAGPIVIEGNFIGTDVTGTKAVPNGTSGIENSNMVYSLADAEVRNNLISGNAGRGIALTGVAAKIEGNFIGTDISGVLPLGNRSTGVWLETSGGHSVISGNIIAFNGIGDPIGGGIVGKDQTANGAYRDEPIILGNAIFDNTSDGSVSDRGLGVDLVSHTADYGPGPNVDICEVGINPPMNFPVLNTAVATGSAIRLRGVLNGFPSTTYRIEFFANPTCDPSGFGEGKTFLGSTNVTPEGFDENDPCNATFDVTLPVAVPAGQSITATATDLSTSEFSACIPVRDLEVVDGLVRLAPPVTRFNPNPVAGGPAGTYSIRATFTNTSTTEIFSPVFQVKELSGGNQLLNADGGPAGAGARLTPDVGNDHGLSPGESFTTEFLIGLSRRGSFTFLVDLLGALIP